MTHTHTHTHTQRQRERQRGRERQRQRERELVIEGANEGRRAREQEVKKEVLTPNHSAGSGPRGDQALVVVCGLSVGEQ